MGLELRRPQLGANALTLPPALAPMKSGISRSVADDKSVSVCPRLFPGPGKDPGRGETQMQTQRPKDGSFGGHWGQPVCIALTCDPCTDKTLSHPWHCGRMSHGCLWQGWHGSAEGTCWCSQAPQPGDAFCAHDDDGVDRFPPLTFITIKSISV